MTKHSPFQNEHSIRVWSTMMHGINHALNTLSQSLARGRMNVQEFR